MKVEKDIITIKEAATILGISKHKIYYKKNTGEIRITSANSILCVYREDLDLIKEVTATRSSRDSFVKPMAISQKKTREIIAYELGRSPSSLLDSKELSEEIGQLRITIYAAMSRGKIPVVRHKRFFFFKREDVPFIAKQFPGTSASSRRHLAKKSVVEALGVDYSQIINRVEAARELGVGYTTILKALHYYRIPTVFSHNTNMFSREHLPTLRRYSKDIAREKTKDKKKKGAVLIGKLLDMVISPSDVLLVKDVCAIMKVSRQAVSALVIVGSLHAYVFDKKQFILRRDLDKYLNTLSVSPATKGVIVARDHLAKEMNIPLEDLLTITEASVILNKSYGATARIYSNKIKCSHKFPKKKFILRQDVRVYT